MKPASGLTALSFLLLSPMALHAQNIEWSKDVKGWYIGVDPSVGNGCFMYSSYEDGGLMRVGFSPEHDNMYVIIGDDNWKSLEEGKKYYIELQFGSRSPWTGDASVFVWDDGDKSLSLDIPFDDQIADLFIQELQETHSVAVTFEGNEILRLSLSGSFAAMAETINCQTEVLAATGGNSDPFSKGGSGSSDPFK